MRAFLVALAVPIGLVAVGPVSTASARHLAASGLAHETGPTAPPNLVFIATNGSLAEVDTLDPSTGKITRLTSTSNTWNDSPGNTAWSSETGSAYFTRIVYPSAEPMTEGHAEKVAQDGSGSVTEVAPAESLDVSTDGRLYAYTTGNLTTGSYEGETTYVAPVAGGTPTKIGVGFHDLRFSRDGQRLIYWNDTGNGPIHLSIFVVNRDGSGKRRVTAAGRCDREPTFSPDGKRMLFTRYGADCAGAGDVYAANTDGTNLRLVAPHASHADWSVNGWLVYCRARQLVLRTPGVPGAERVLPNTQDDCYPHFKR